MYLAVIVCPERVAVGARLDDELPPGVWQDLLGHRWLLDFTQTVRRRGVFTYLSHNPSRVLFLARRLLGIDDPRKLVLHRNGNALDLRRANLEVLTRKEWATRRKAMRGPEGQSRYKGVSRWRAPVGWRARIVVDGKQVWLGCFKTEVEAALAYDRSACHLYGSGCYLNFPEHRVAE